MEMTNGKHSDVNNEFEPESYKAKSKSLREQAGPAAMAFVCPPDELLHPDQQGPYTGDPWDDPERYMEVVQPLWDATVEQIEEDFQAALALRRRLDKRFDDIENTYASHRVSSQQCRIVEQILLENGRAFGMDRTLFESLGLKPSGRSVQPIDGKWHPDPQYGKSYVFEFIVPTPKKRNPDDTYTIGPKDCIYLIHLPQNPSAPAKERVFTNSLISLLGSYSWNEAMRAANFFVHYPWDPGREGALLSLRSEILDAALREFELKGKLDRYEKAAESGVPPGTSHAWKLVHDGDYCAQQSRTLVREEDITRTAAHAKLVEDVQRVRPNDLPYYPTPQSLADTWKARKWRVSDVKSGDQGE